MTREEALKYAENKYSCNSYRCEMGYLNKGLSTIAERENEFLRVAISALREQGNCIEFESIKRVESDPVKLVEIDHVQTNADRIRAMSDEELAKEMLFFCPTDTVFKGENTYGKPHYTGLDGSYYATSEEAVVANLEWLKQPAEEEKP